MKTVRIKYLAFLAFIFSSNILSAQSVTSTPSYLIYALIGIGLLVVFGAIMMLTDNLLGIEADKHGVDLDSGNTNMFQKIKGLFKKAAPNFVDESKFHDLSKGYDIKLQGAARGEIKNVQVSRFAVKPQNFNGISPIPKIMVELGDEVKAGDPIFYDKKRPDIKYVAPVSGEVVEVRRGAKRSIAAVVILADKDQSYRSIDVPSLDGISRESLVSFLQENGAWSLLEQRPFNIIPSTDSIPANIFISTFDSAPLAPNSNIVVEGHGAAFQKGIDVLNKLTSGKVYLGLNANEKPSSVFTNAENVEKHWFRGKHPAGNVGVQIHHMAPITGSNVVWTLGVQELITLGKLFTEKKFDTSRVVALTGAPLNQPKYVRTHLGANVADLLKGESLDESIRIIAGDVLSGEKVTTDDFLNFKDDQITAIAEGNQFELFGWLLPLAPRPSISKTFPSFLMPNYEFEGNTNTHGEKRAFVVSGQYESVLPMDIYPQHLMKAILTGDIEKMEGLGINELAEEDIALCEFVCTSKQPLQKILREGLNTLQEQL